MAAAEAPGKKKKEKAPREAEPVFVNQTPKGEKKDLKGEMAKAYHPPAVEAAWDDWWEAKGFYRADEKDTTKPTYVIMLPPPNVTGSLHIGHALTVAIQDTITRWRRMTGHNCLWLPGTDHAGIATQVVVEKKLQRERGQSRHDIGREAFVQEVWGWKEQFGDRICSQLRRLGASLDWSRLSFTMDDQLSRGVQEAFLRMHKQGIIYRGHRLCNWDVSLKSTVSDLEVDYEELAGPTKLRVPGYERMVEFGVLTEFAYKVDGGDEEIVVATTRVETMLGDTAVAVHPEDPRYKALHGKFLRHPFVDRLIPIITDAELVDMEFGTGAVKVTPAHDPNDYATGQRHKLEFINIFTDDGNINENGGSFCGQPRFGARYTVTEKLKELGLFRDTKPNPGMKIPRSQRSKDIIEPMVKFQWWVDCKDMAARSCQAVRSGELKIVPEMHQHTWFRFLENIRDWCISRQLWWGHRIPAFYVIKPGDAEEVPLEEDTNRWIVAPTEADARAIAQDRFPDIPAADLRLVQDPDVLDTWFSSGLFPFSTLGWPDEASPDFARFFPNHLLETGHDILFFWVARMVMMSFALCDKIPFNTVYLHAMVRDAHGRKMSKSLGNVVDPVDVIQGITLQALQKSLEGGNLDANEVKTAQNGQKKDFPAGIPECGTDALRFALCDYTSQGRDVNLNVLRVEGYRHMCNKMWNACRFCLLNFEEGYSVGELPTPAEASFVDRWILSRLDAVVTEVTQRLEAFEFADATKACYRFFYYELCDYYIELVKPLLGEAPGGRARFLTQNTLHACLHTILKLFHPFMPFVTEELWQRLPRRDGDAESIMIAEWPKALGRNDPAAEEQFVTLQDTIKTARSMREAYGLKPSMRPTMILAAKSAQVAALMRDRTPEFSIMVSAGEVTVQEPGVAAPEGCGMRPVGDSLEVHIVLAGAVDVDVELAKLEKQKSLKAASLDKLVKKRAGANYAKVPPKTQEEEGVKVEALQVELDAIAKSMETFLKLKD